MGTVQGIAPTRHARIRGALVAAMPRKRLLVASLLMAGAFCSTSCTLAKPFVCAVTTPIYVLGKSSGSGSCGYRPEGAACALLVVSAIGAAGGLVTGIISDINILNGDVDDPTRNFHDPFATNTSDGSFR